MMKPNQIKYPLIIYLEYILYKGAIFKANKIMLKQFFRYFADLEHVFFCLV